MRPPKVSSFLCRLRFVDHKQNQNISSEFFALKLILHEVPVFYKSEVGIQ